MTQIPFLGAYKTVLFLTDDETIIYKGVGKGADLVGRVAWEDPQFIDKAVSIIKQYCGIRPIIVLNDMSEQFYKVDRVPTIKNPLDRNSMIKRKVVAAFPQYKITGALIQTEKRKGQKEVDQRVVMAALPLSQKMQRVNNVLNFSGLQILNIGLLPVEMSSMVDALSNALIKDKDKDKNNWTIFVAQNSSGGLRQIVTKNGRMALTRMTPVVSTDIDADIWASEVSQELKATLTYLTRFDYHQDDNLEVVVVSNAQAGQVLEGLIEVPCRFFSLTVEEVAQHLKIGQTSIDREQGRFIDAIYARWAGNKLSFDMDMKAEEVVKAAQARLGAVAASFLLVLSLFYLSSQAYNTYNAYAKASQDIVSARGQLQRAETANRQAVEDSKVSEYNVDLIKGAVDAYHDYAGKGIKPTLYLQRINKAMQSHNILFSGVDMRIESVEDSDNSNVRRPARANPRNRAVPAAAQAKKPSVSIRLQLVFPGQIAPEVGNIQVQRLADSIQQEFNDLDLDVSVTRFLRDMTFQAPIQGRVGTSQQNNSRNTAVFNAEILISGEVAS